MSWTGAKVTITRHSGQAAVEVLLLVAIAVAIWFAPGPDGADSLWFWLADVGHGWLRFYRWVWQYSFVLPGVA